MKIGEAFQGKYLRAHDILGKRVPVVISHVEIERVGDKKEAKPVVYFKGKELGLVLNKGNANAIWGINGSDDMDDWGGTKLTLYTAATTKPDGSPTMGLRVDPPDHGASTGVGRPAGSASAARPAPIMVEPLPDDEGDADDTPF